MKHFHKFLSLALALMLCLSLAACGESNEDYGDDGSDYNLYGVPDSFEGLVKDSEQMANLYIYGGAWTGEDGGTLIVANNDEGDEVRFALYDIDEELTASGFIQFVPEYDYDYFYNEHDGVAYRSWFDEDGALQSLLGDNFLPHAFKLSMKDLTNYQETADAIMKIDGIDKIIESRLDKRSMGFGAEIQSKKERDVGQLLKEIQPQDLLKFGIIPELVGRLPVITTLRSLGREQMVQILTEPKNSLVKQYRKLMEYDDVDLEFTPEALEAAADRAIERGIGARGLRAILEEVMTRIMYDVPSDPEVVKVTITEDCIRSGAAPEILRDPEHSQRPALGQADLRAERGGLPGTNAG